MFFCVELKCPIYHPIRRFSVSRRTERARPPEWETPHFGPVPRVPGESDEQHRRAGVDDSREFKSGRCAKCVTGKSGGCAERLGLKLAELLLARGLTSA